MTTSTLRAGWALRALDLLPRGHAMHGFGMWHYRARRANTALFARAVYIEDAGGAGSFFCCLDTGYVTHAMREGIVAGLRAALGAGFREELLVLTCTHTHSGPGGCTHDALYNMVTPGFVPENLEGVVRAAVAALLAARAGAAPAELRLAGGSFEPHAEVAWNRSLRAYHRNPDVVRVAEDEAHLAIDRRMQVLGFFRHGRAQALVSFFGVHATCVGNGLDAYDGDNKGYAAAFAEARLRDAGAAAPVAIFAQATAGDVSPWYHGPGQAARRQAVHGAAEYAYARANGEHQARLALTLLAQAGTPLQGALDAVLSYADFSTQEADPRYTGGVRGARTSEPCHGTAFFQGTPVDGPGMPAPLGAVAGGVARLVRAWRLAKWTPVAPQDRDYYRQLYAAQGPKQVLLESGRKRVLGQRLERLLLPGVVDPLVNQLKQQARRGALTRSALVPTVLPLQILRLGPLALVCCPGEFTTTAGARLRAAVRAELVAAGVRDVLICTYCNDYMGYVTTYEEYQEQAYEGGHTIFGQWTLAAFQTRFAALARELGRPEASRRHDRTTRPLPAPADELALRSNLPLPAAPRCNRATATSLDRGHTPHPLHVMEDTP